MPATAALLLTLAAATADPTLVAVNHERARHDLKPLVQHATLERTSQAFATHLHETGTFAHAARIQVPRHRFARVGEALAKGTTLTPSQAVREWMRSPPHRRLLLSRHFTHAGAGEAGTIRVLHLAVPTAAAS